MFVIRIARFYVGCTPTITRGTPHKRYISTSSQLLNTNPNNKFNKFDSVYDSRVTISDSKDLRFETSILDDYFKTSNATKGSSFINSDSLFEETEDDFEIDRRANKLLKNSMEKDVNTANEMAIFSALAGDRVDAEQLAYKDTSLSDEHRFNAKVILCRIFLGIESPTEKDFNKLTKEVIEKELKYWYPSATPKLNMVRERIINEQKTIAEVSKSTTTKNTYRPTSSAFFTASSPFYGVFLKLEEIFLVLHKIEASSFTAIQKDDRARKVLNSIVKYELSAKIPIDQAAFEMIIGEKVTDTQYDKFVSMVYKLVSHEYASLFYKNIEKYIKNKVDITTMGSMVANDANNGASQSTNPSPLLSFSQLQADGSLLCVTTKKNVSAQAVFKLGTGSLTINGLALAEIFSRQSLRAKVVEPFSVLRAYNKYDISVTTQGYGENATADAVRSSIARGLSDLEMNESAVVLNELGYLWKDTRMPLRNLPGRKGPRAGYTWVKR